MATVAETPDARKLSIATKLAYGVGDVGPAVVSAITGFFLNAFLIEIAGVRPASAALIFLLIKVWDAANDPIIGRLTDMTNTRWGRRRPWLLFGAIPFALAFYLHWLVPDLSQAGLFWYYPRIPHNARLSQIATGMVCGGALGNALDRIQHGHVIDFIHYRIPDVISNVSNLADHAIVLGVVLIFMDSWRLDRIEARQAALESKTGLDAALDAPTDDPAI